MSQNIETYNIELDGMPPDGSVTQENIDWVVDQVRQYLEHRMKDTVRVKTEITITIR